MTRRLVMLWFVLLTLGLLVNCGQNAQLSTITVSPATASIAGAGATAQFTANGLFENGKNGNQHNQDLTTQVTWTSSVPSVATINSGGLATGVSAGTTTITATGGNGSIAGTATLTVGNGTGTGHDLTGITIIPATGVQIVTHLNETAQYIAIGNFTGNPPNQDMTNLVTWSSSDVNVATINSAGLATAVNNGQTTITALATVAGGGAITGTSDLTVNTAGGGNGLPTLTVYKVGQGTGTVTSSPAGINCGSGPGCTGNFVLNSQVTLTAVPDAGSTFGGWSANCTPSNQPTCSLPMTDNQTVGAIFNKQ